MSTAEQIHAVSQTTPATALQSEVVQHLDKSFSDLDFVLGHAGPSTHSGNGRYGKRKRTLNEEIDHWERDEAAASRDVSLFLYTLAGAQADEL